MPIVTYNDSDLVNCTVNIASGSEVSVTQTYIFTADSGFAFADGVAVEFALPWGDESVYGELSKNNTVLTVEIISGNDYHGLSTGAYVVMEVPTTKPYKLTIVEGALVNCTADVDDVSTYDETDIIVTFTADDGYVFEGRLEYRNEYGVTTYLRIDSSNLNAEGNVLVAELPVDENTVIISLIAVVDTSNTDDEDLSDVRMFTEIFIMTDLKLREFSDERYTHMPDTRIEDLGNYISTLYEIPFNIDGITVKKDGVVAEKPIRFGFKQSTLESSYLGRSSLKVNLGDIVVSEKYNNAYDYTNVECILNVPFVKPIILESVKVINQTIRVEYIIDLYTRNTSINVYSSFNDNIIYTELFEVGNTIPYLQRSLDIVNTDVNVQIENYIDNSFIEVIRNVPYGDRGLFGKDVVEFGLLNSYVGYVEISKVDLEVSCNDSERSEIENLLSQGVFINV